MELKDYQQQALDTLDRYLEALNKARQKADEWAALLSSKEISDTLGETALAVTKDIGNYPHQAWESLRKAATLPGVTDAQGRHSIPEHISRESAAGEPIPHVCLKVPTGGGKTPVRCGGSPSLETRHRFRAVACADQSHLCTDVERFSVTKNIRIARFWSVRPGDASNSSKKTIDSRSRISKTISA